METGNHRSLGETMKTLRGDGQRRGTCESRKQRKTYWFGLCLSDAGPKIIQSRAKPSSPELEPSKKEKLKVQHFQLSFFWGSGFGGLNFGSGELSYYVQMIQKRT